MTKMKQNAWRGAVFSGALLTVMSITGVFGTSAWAQDQVQAGVSAAVRGDVSIARTNAVGRQIDSGESVFLNDEIISGPDSGMQILLLDETVFTIGPESELTIDKYVYDPATGEGSLAATMGKGLMRFASGKISDGAPENMTIKLPVGTIGIRGTIGVIVVLTPEQASTLFPNQFSQLNTGGNTPVIFASLAGPGPLSQTGSGVGSFNFSSPNGNVDLNRPGGSVLAVPGQPPVFFLVPPGAFQQVTSGFVQRGSTGSSGGDQNSDGQDQGGNQANGQGGAGGGTGNSGQQSKVGNDLSFKQGQDFSSNQEQQSAAKSTTEDFVSSQVNSLTFNDLAAFTGSVSFITGMTTYGGAANFYVSNFSIGFDQRDIYFEGGVDGGTVHTGIGTTTSVSWSSLVGNDAAIFVIGGTGSNVDSSNGSCTLCSVSLTFTAKESVNAVATDSAGETTSATITPSGGT